MAWMKLGVLSCLALVLAWSAGNADAQSPSAERSATLSGSRVTLSTVLDRAGAYVEEFQRELSGIVVEETYLQEVIPFLGMNARGQVRAERRKLRSDFLLLRPEASITWVQFRDVF